MGIQAESTGILDIIRGMGGFIDENGMLQLGKGFCVGESIPPHGKIFQDFAECVQEAYGETGLREVSEAEARMIHQFGCILTGITLRISANFSKEME